MEAMRMLSDLEICSATAIAEDALDASALENAADESARTTRNLGVGASALLRHLFRQRFSPTSSRSLQQVLTSYALTHDRTGDEDATDYRSAYHQLCDWLYGWDVADIADQIVGKGDQQFSIRRVPRAFDVLDPTEQAEARRILEAFQTLFSMSLRTLRRAHMDMEDKLPHIGKNIAYMFSANESGENLDEEGAVWGQSLDKSDAETSGAVASTEITTRSSEDLLKDAENTLNGEKEDPTNGKAMLRKSSMLIPPSQRLSIVPLPNRRTSTTGLSGRKASVIGTSAHGGRQTSTPGTDNESVQKVGGSASNTRELSASKGQGLLFPAPPKSRQARRSAKLVSTDSTDKDSTSTPLVDNQTPKPSTNTTSSLTERIRSSVPRELSMTEIVQRDIDLLFLMAFNTCDYMLVCVCSSVLILALSECLNEKEAFTRQMQNIHELANLFISNTLKTVWHVLHRTFEEVIETPSDTGIQGGPSTPSTHGSGSSSIPLPSHKPLGATVDISLTQVRDPQQLRLLMQQILKDRNYKSNDKEFIAMSKAHHKFILLNDVMSGLDVFIFPPFVPAHAEGAKGLCSTSFDPNIWVSGGYDCAIRIWDMSNKTCLAQYVGHKSIITDTHFTRNYAYIVSSSFDRSVKIWNAQNATCERTLLGHTDSVTTCDVSPDGRYILSGSVDNTLRLWDFLTGDCIAMVKKHTRYVKMVRFSPDGRYAVSAGLDRRLYIWDVKIFAYSKNITHTRCIEAHEDYILAIDLARPTYLVSTSRDQTVKLWDYITGQCHYAIKLVPSWACSVSFSFDGDMFATASFDNVITIFKTETGEKLRSLRVFNLGIVSVRFSCKSYNFIVCGTSEGLLQKIQL